MKGPCLWCEMAFRIGKRNYSKKKHGYTMLISWPCLKFQGYMTFDLSSVIDIFLLEKNSQPSTDPTGNWEPLSGITQQGGEESPVHQPATERVDKTSHKCLSLFPPVIHSVTPSLHCLTARQEPLCLPPYKQAFIYKHSPLSTSPAHQHLDIVIIYWASPVS